MFLNYVNKILNRTTSLQLRLTIFYGITTFILMVILSGAFYWMMTDLLYKSEQQLLTDEIDIVKNTLLKNETDLKTLKYKIQEIPPILDSAVYDHYIRVLDENRNIITETDKMTQYVGGNLFFDKIIHSHGKHHLWWRAPDGTDYLLMQMKVSGKLIQIALDVSFQRNIINDYQTKLFLGLALGLLLSLIIGHLLAKRGLKGLHDLAHATKKITATSLNQRIDPYSWPKELRELGISLNQMLERIETSFSKLLQLSGDLAHELRTPINNLIGGLEVSICHAKTEDEYKNIIESSLEESQRISRMVENMLFMARTENPKLVLEKIQIDVAKEILSIGEFYQAILEEKNIRFSCSGNAFVSANHDMFRRVINNLLSNAIKFTKNSISFEIINYENSVIIRISDNGIGIHDQHQARIFDRFYKIDSSRQNTHGGTGLGLAIVKSILELHHAAITVKSTPSIETIFAITFPK